MAGTEVEGIRRRRPIEITGHIDPPATPAPPEAPPVIIRGAQRLEFVLKMCYAQAIVPEEVAVNVAVLVGKNLLVTLRQMVASRDGGSIRVPSSWVEAAKERWMPLAVKKAWPVKYREYLATAFYPDVPVPQPYRKNMVVRWGEVESGG